MSRDASTDERQTDESLMDGMDERPACGGAADMSEQMKAQFSAFRSKLDAHRIRARSSSARLGAPSRKSPPVAPSPKREKPASAETPIAAPSAQPAPKKAVVSPSISRTLPSAELESAVSDDRSVADATSSAPVEARERALKPERFEIVFPPASVRAAEESAGVSAAAIASPALVAGLACAALLASAGAVVEASNSAEAPQLAVIEATRENVSASIRLAEPVAKTTAKAGSIQRESEAEPGGKPALATPSKMAPPKKTSSKTAATALAGEEIETATVPPRTVEPSRSQYLRGDELRALLAERPIKCVVEDAATAAGASKDVCAETVAYEVAQALMVREAPAPEGGRIEINAAFSIEGDALCHQTRGLSALVIGGEMPADRARSLEQLLSASYAGLNGSPICHRLQALGEAAEGPVFRAHAFVNGKRVAERTDPRPFLMRRRAPRQGLRHAAKP